MGLEPMRSYEQQITSRTVALRLGLKSASLTNSDTDAWEQVPGATLAGVEPAISGLEVPRDIQFRHRAINVPGEGRTLDFGLTSVG